MSKEGARERESEREDTQRHTSRRHVLEQGCRDRALVFKQRALVF